MRIRIKRLELRVGRFHDHAGAWRLAQSFGQALERRAAPPAKRRAPHDTGTRRKR